MKVKIPESRKRIINVLAGFFVIFPWITYLKVMQLSDAEKLVFTSQSGVSLDFFLYTKEIVMLLMLAIVLIFYFAERVLVKKKDNNIPLIKGDNKLLYMISGIFGACVLIATVFSEQKKNAFWGSPTECEGLWVLLGYIVVILMFYNYFANDYGVRLMQKAVVVLSTMTVVLSMIEYFYKPLLEIGFVKMLIAPARYQEVMSTIESGVFSNSISLTFYNPAYLGGFVCLLLPFIVSLYMGAERGLNKVLLTCLCVGLMFCVIVTNTTTTLYLAILELFLVFAFTVWKGKDKKKVLATGGIFASVILASAVVFGVITGNSIGSLLTNANSATGEVVEERFVIKDFVLKDHSVVVVGETLHLEIISGEEGLLFANENGEALTFEKDGGKYEVLESGYENIDVYIAYNPSEQGDPAAKIFVDAGYDNTIDFLILRDGRVTGVGLLDSIVTDIGGNEIPESLKKYYGLFTGRGYAWINSVPLLKETLLIGKGPGNFAFHFKQGDYAGLLSTHENAKTIIDKPHNTYLQFAINLGIPGMIAFFGIILITLWKAVKVWNKNCQLEESHTKMHLGGVVAVFGFLIYSIVNDSMITVTPVLCMLVGWLLATTYIQKNQ